MKVLIATNQLSVFAGGALVAIEIAQVLSKMGYYTIMCAPYIADPLESYVRNIGIGLVNMEECDPISEFDIIWGQNQILSALLAEVGVDSPLPRIFVASLSPYEPMEMQGAIVEVAEKVVVNSHETSDRLIELGVDAKKIFVFHNAAPECFCVQRTEQKILRSILAVSNQAPPELDEAIQIISAMGINVQKVGFPRDQAVVSPELIQSHDAVITIGKTTQYAIQSAKPVYVYDKFGGPGWLSLDNAERAAYFNFSGRCCNRHLNPEYLANEIIAGYHAATLETRHLNTHFGRRFHLPTQVKKLMTSSNVMTTPSTKIRSIIRREGVLAKCVATMFAESQRHLIHIDTLKRKIADQNSELKYHINALESHMVEYKKLESHALINADTLQRKIEDQKNEINYHVSALESHIGEYKKLEHAFATEKEQHERTKQQLKALKGLPGEFTPTLEILASERR